MPRAPRTLLSAAEFERLATELAQVEPGVADPVAGLASARTGTVVTTGDRPADPALPDRADVIPAAPNPYRLRQWTEDGSDWSATNDRLELDIHGATAMTHLDATSHFAWSQSTVPAGSRGGMLAALAASGLVGRGVLIDVPGALGPVTSGDVITLDDVHAAITGTGVQLLPGDALYLRFGREETAHSDVPLGSVPMSGLSIECARWLAAARPSVVVTDQGLDTVPSEVDGHPVPWHLLLLTVLGIPLVDAARLGDLSRACATASRWEFLSVIAPLPIPDASGSPVNPLAIL